MLTEPTNEKLQAMRLETMATTWRDQTGKPDIHKLAFDERFGMLVDAEWLSRENKRLAAALRDAKLRIASACTEDIDYRPHRELDKAQIRQLATCRWVVEHQNVQITGATGTGKTYIAEFGPSRSPKPVDGDHRNRSMAITETGHGDRRNRASRSPKPVMAIA